MIQYARCVANRLAGVESFCTLTRIDARHFALQVGQHPHITLFSSTWRKLQQNIGSQSLFTPVHSRSASNKHALLHRIVEYMKNRSQRNDATLCKCRARISMPSGAQSPRNNGHKGVRPLYPVPSIGRPSMKGVCAANRHRCMAPVLFGRGPLICTSSHRLEWAAQ